MGIIGIFAVSIPLLLVYFVLMMTDNVSVRVKIVVSLLVIALVLGWIFSF